VAAMIAADPRSAEVIFPYLDGVDLNGSADSSARRYVINFGEWSEEQAKQYSECYRRVAERVKPERARNNDRRRRTIWWQFTRPTSELYRAIKDHDRVPVIVRVSDTVVPLLVPTRQVFHEKLVVFTSTDAAFFAVLSSSPHYLWVISQRTTHGVAGSTTYAPERCLETFPFPSFGQDLRDLGDRLDRVRLEVMSALGSGATATYGLVHDRACTVSGVAELRAIHSSIDEAVLRAYGWDDLLDQLDRGFHLVGRETRYTIGPTAQREILDRLLELNHERYAEEVTVGLHDKGKKRGTAPARKSDDDQGTLL
jgi:hypothetical protein